MLASKTLLPDKHSPMHREGFWMQPCRQGPPRTPPGACVPMQTLMHPSKAWVKALSPPGSSITLGCPWKMPAPLVLTAPLGFF